MRTGLNLQVAQAARIEIALEVGSLNEAVTVTGEAPLLDSTTSAVGQVVAAGAIVNLPLNQRNPFSLILLVPGAVGTVGNDPVGGNFSVNGGREGANEVLLDGVSSTPLSDNSNRLTIFPSVDARRLHGELELRRPEGSAGNADRRLVCRDSRSGALELRDRQPGPDSERSSRARFSAPTAGIYPFYGLISTGNLSGRTVQQRYLLRPFPQLDGFRDLLPSIGFSIYHSFQLKVEKRFASGLSFLLAYTNSKLIDNVSQNNGNFGGGATTQNANDMRHERSVSPIDSPQRLVFSYVYELPIGRGRTLGRNWNRVVDALAGGWQLNGIATFQRGFPLLLTATNNVNAFNDGERPNNNGSSAKLEVAVEDRLNQYFKTSVFSQPPAAFQFGNVSRTLPDVRAPGARSMDLSLFKNFKLREKLTLQFRAEAFNALNTPQFAGPNTSVSSVSFGAISATANSPRQIQFGLEGAVLNHNTVHLSKQALAWRTHSCVPRRDSSRRPCRAFHKSQCGRPMRRDESTGVLPRGNSPW